MMKSPLRLALLSLLLAGQTLGGEGDLLQSTPAAASPNLLVDDPDDASDDESDEVDDDDAPEALDDEVCDKLWAVAKEQEDKMFVDEIVEWESLCAMRNGLCELGEPYWSMGFRHGRIFFSYRHDALTIKTRVRNTMEERCESPEVNWEKMGEKYKAKQQIKDFRRFYGNIAKQAVRGKRRHRRHHHGKKSTDD